MGVIGVIGTIGVIEIVVTRGGAPEAVRKAVTLPNEAEGVGTVDTQGVLTIVEMTATAGAEDLESVDADCTLFLFLVGRSGSSSSLEDEQEESASFAWRNEKR